MSTIQKRKAKIDVGYIQANFGARPTASVNTDGSAQAGTASETIPMTYSVRFWLTPDEKSVGDFNVRMTCPTDIGYNLPNDPRRAITDSAWFGEPIIRASNDEALFISLTQLFEQTVCESCEMEFTLPDNRPWNPEINSVLTFQREGIYAST